MRQKRPQYAHRVAYELTYGPIPAGVQVLHTCDNPPCVRPEHLFLGTRSDNMRDMVAKQRHRAVTKPATLPRGERNSHAKLTETDVQTIRRLRRDASMTYLELAHAFGVTKSTVAFIIRRETWTHIP